MSINAAQVQESVTARRRADAGESVQREQIIGILREHEVGAKTPDLCRRHGISDATFYKWKAQYGGPEVSCIVDEFSRASPGTTFIRASRSSTPLSKVSMASYGTSVNEHVFLNLTEARAIIERWRHDYNFVRPHSSLGALTPMEFVAQPGDRSPEQAQGSAARPLALPPHLGHNINPGRYP